MLRSVGTSASPSKPRKPRRTNVRVAGTSTAAPTGVPKPTSTPTSSYGSPDWGPSYYKPRPGFQRTLEQLRASIGNDQNTSYILGDLLEARYGKMSDVRDSYFQGLRQESEHQYNLAEIYARQGQEYEPQLPEVQGLPKGQGPKGLIKQLMQDIAAHPGDQKYAEGISGVYQDRIEDALDIKNDIRDYKQSTEGYKTNFDNTIEELVARGEYNPSQLREPGQSSLTQTGENPLSKLLASWGGGKSTGKKPSAPRGTGDLGRDLSMLDSSDTEEADSPGIFEAAKASLLGSPIRDQLSENDDGVSKFLSKMGDETEDSFWWTIDKLSRPLYGTASGAEEFYDQDKGENEFTEADGLKGVIGGLTGSWSPFGKSVLDSADDVIKNPLSVPKEFLAGFGDGGLGMADDPTMFAEVIKSNADAVEKKTIHDNPKWQLGWGLGADLAFDPLNFVGAGLIKAPLKATSSLDDLRALSNVKKDSNVISKFLEESEAPIPFADVQLTPNEIQRMLLGTDPQGTRPKTYADRKRMMESSSEAGDYLAKVVESRVLPKGKLSTNDLDNVYAGLERQRKSAIDRAGGQTYIAELERDLGIKARRGESTEDLPEVLETAQLTKIMHSALEREKSLDGLIDTHFKDYDFNNWHDVEDHYDNLLKRYRNDPKVGKELDAFREKVDAALDPQVLPDGTLKDLPGQDINELMGPGWMQDPRISPRQTSQLLRAADRLAKGDNELRSLSTGYGAIKANVDFLRKGVEKARRDNWSPNSIREAEQRLYNAERALKFNVAQVNMRKADYFMRLIKSQLNHQAGIPTYADPKSAEQLLGLREAVAAKRATAGTGDQNISTLAERVVDDSDVELLIRDELGNTRFDDTLVNESNPRFKDMAHQLDYVDKTAARELKHMSYDPDRPWNAMGLQERVVSEVPTMFRDSAGDLNMSAIQQHVNVNQNTGVAVIKPTGDEVVDSWLDDVKSVYEQKYYSLYGKAVKNAKRPINEAHAAESVINSADEELLNLFKVKGKQAELRIAPGTKGLVHWIDQDGQQLENGKLFRELVQPTAGDTQTSQAMLALVKELQEGTAFRHQSVGRLRDHLYDAGYSVPQSPTKFREWLLGASGNQNRLEKVRLLMEPSDIAFRRIFKEQKGMTIREATRKLNEARGDVVRLKGDWGKKYPEGITKSDFVADMTNSLETFMDVTNRGPFKVRIGTAKSAKMVQDAGEDFEKWATANYRNLMNMTQADRSAVLDKIWKATSGQQKTALKAEEGLQEAAVAVEKKQLSGAQYATIRKESGTKAWNQLKQELEHGSATVEVENQSLKLWSGIGPDSSSQEIFDVLKYRLGETEAQLKFEKMFAGKQKDYAEVARINDELAKLKTQRGVLEAEHKARVQTAKETQTLMASHLRTDALMRAAGLNLQAQRTSLGLNVMGKFLEVPGARQLVAATEATAGLPIIKQTRQVWADLFKAPSSTLEPAMQLMRSRALGETPIIIERDIKGLKELFSGMHIDKRKRAQKMFIRNVDTDHPDVQAVKQAFDPTLMDHFQNKVKIGDSYLTLGEINKYLPNGMKLDLRGVSSFDTPQDLIKNMLKANGDGAHDLKDPYRVSWNTRIAVHQAAARKALEQTLYKVYAVKKLDASNPASVPINKLKNEGFREIPELSEGHLFPQEIIPDVRSLLDMLEPRNIEQFGRLVDRATSYWKTITTVYNPGYWSRNAIGEMMSSWFGGVHGVAPYRKAKDVISFARQDGDQLEALGKQFPWLNYTPTESVKGNKELGITSGGLKFNPEQVWTLFHDRGLKTGFFNTEFDHQFSWMGNKLRTNPGSEYAAKAHVKVRSAGEWYEDYFRIAHFIDRITKSRARTLEGAADEAAEAVRKYHFDYTDFTNFEKMAMLRAFPFYKWTRKALPLMTTMLFTKPGKVMAYPKIMNTISSHDVGGDDNGFAPNYEGIVPGWIQDMWAYQIAESGEEPTQTETFFNLATPQMDSYKAITHPGNTAYGLLNPLLKIPDQQIAEQATGRSIGDIAGSSAYDFGSRAEEGGNSYFEDSIKSLLKSTPQTNYLQKPMGNSDFDWQDSASFWTGLGFYQSDEKRRLGELMNGSD